MSDSIMTLFTRYYLSLIISFFSLFHYKCIHSSFEIHSAFVTVIVATCSVCHCAFHEFIINAHYNHTMLLL